MPGEAGRANGAISVYYATIFSLAIVLCNDTVAVEGPGCGQLLSRAFTTSWGLPQPGATVDLQPLVERCDTVAAPSKTDRPGTQLTFIGLRAYVGGDSTTAYEAWTRAAEAGNPLAMVALGDLTFRTGLDDDLFEEGASAAFAAYRTAAGWGSPLAMSKLAWLYDQGYHVERDPAEALAWYMKAAEAGEPTAMHNVGNFFKTGTAVAKDIETAIRWYEWAGQAGSAAAYHSLGVLYDEGLEIPEDDSKAVHYYRLAAYGDHREAMPNLARMYKQGAGVERNYAEAVHWYQRAIDAGLDSAGSNLGEMYYEGVGVERNLETALRYFLLAATAGRPEAMAKASSVYMDLGAYRAAYFWTVLATKAGKREVAFRLAELQALLPDTVMAETEAQALAWTPGSPPPKL